MELFFLGTGAADRLYEPVETTFDNRDKRRCACALLDGHILLDCGPHALASMRTANIDPAAITDILITHLHSDHFSPETIREIALAAPRTLNIWVREDAVFGEIKSCAFHRMTCFTEYTVGAYRVTGLPANHQSFPQHLSIEDGEKKLFYGGDGAWLLGDTVRFMQDKKYDTIVLDATVGDYAGDYRMGEHNSIPMLRLMVPSMKTLAIADENTKIILSHLAVCLHRSYKETCALTEKDGFVIAYDGMNVLI